MFVMVYIKLICAEAFKEAQPGALVQSGFLQRRQEPASVPAFAVSVEFKNWALLPNTPLVNWNFFLAWQRRRMRVSLTVLANGTGSSGIREAAAPGSGGGATQPGGSRIAGKMAKNAGDNADATVEAETEEETSNAEDWDSEYDELPGCGKRKPADRLVGGDAGAMPNWEISGGVFSVTIFYFAVRTCNYFLKFALSIIESEHGRAPPQSRRRRRAP